METFDVIIVGAGPGGYVAAIRAAQNNLKTAIIEREYYGGVCLNVGCIPTKTLLSSSLIVDHIKNAEKHGIELVNKKYLLNWTKMQKRKSDVSNMLAKGVELLMDKNKITKIWGNAKAIDLNTIEVSTKKYQFKKLILATGSKPRSLPIEGFKEGEKAKIIIDSTDALSLKEIPKELFIIGGGVIGVEFACLYNRLGSKVTILQATNSILELLDSEVSKEMTRIFTRDGINILTNVSILKLEKDVLHYKANNEIKKVKADKILVSVGRIPTFDGFESLNLKLSSRGSIITDKRMKTNLPNIYAIGDVTASKMLAHVASAQARVAINSILDIEDGLNENNVPNCIYSYPEVASVGLTEEEVKAKQYNYKKFKFPLSVLGKAIADGNTDGFVKLIVDNNSKQLLGGHIISTHATDMISELVTAMELETTAEELARSIHPHPTLSEAIMEAAEGIVFKPISM